MFNPCVLIPIYNHEASLAEIIKTISAKGLPIIVVDDGSNSDCKDKIEELKKTYKLTVRTLPENQGKGAAIKQGIITALEKKHSHALQIDADGQHNLNDIERFINEAKNNPDALISGIPIYDASVPKARLYGKLLTHIWVCINTLSTKLKDSMCGFRAYPVKSSMELFMNNNIGKRMDYDTDFIVHWYWEGKPVIQIPTKVTYPQDGISHFMVWRDNKLISLMHARHFFGMLLRLPVLLSRKISE